MTCHIVAEVGWNHGGDMDLAKRMIEAAAQAGADFVKFQTWRVDKLKPGPWDKDGRREIYRAAELTPDQHALLIDACRRNGVQFLTSVFDPGDVPMLSDFGLPIIKIPSHEAYNMDLLRSVDGKFERVLVSTGASDWEEVLQIPGAIRRSELSLMHCVSAYPCPADRVNLPRLAALKTLTPSIGYSGHFEGVNDALAAIAFGVDYVEKHFTIDHSLPGRDNRFAVLPQDLENICQFRDMLSEMSLDRGRDLQECEQDVKENYRGRWSAPEYSQS